MKWLLNTWILSLYFLVQSYLLELDPCVVIRGAGSSQAQSDNVFNHDNGTSWSPSEFVESFKFLLEVVGRKPWTLIVQALIWLYLNRCFRTNTASIRSRAKTDKVIIAANALTTQANHQKQAYARRQRFGVLHNSYWWIICGRNHF